MNEWARPTLLVALGGAAGSVARFWLGRWLNAGLPWGTLAANTVGTFVLALAVTLCAERADPPRREALWLVGSGFCGGFTTFSALQWEWYERVRDGRTGEAFGYLALTLVAGFAAVWIGARAGR